MLINWLDLQAAALKDWLKYRKQTAFTFKPDLFFWKCDLLERPVGKNTFVANNWEQSIDSCWIFYDCIIHDWGWHYWREAARGRFISNSDWRVPDRYPISFGNIFHYHCPFCGYQVFHKSRFLPWKSQHPSSNLSEDDGPPPAWARVNCLQRMRSTK